MASLVMMLSLRAKGAGPSAIARELALELGDGSFAPDLVEHLPGVSNVEADLLSRRFDPAYQPWQLPAAFQGVPETTLPARPLGWYWTITNPISPTALQTGISGSESGASSSSANPAATTAAGSPSGKKRKVPFQ